MRNLTKIALAAALIGGTASAALANDSGENNMGGYVLPGNTAGVNPAYHPRWFPNYPRSEARQSDAYGAYGYLPAAKHHVTHVRPQTDR